MRYFEDLEVGGPRKLGTATITREEIRAFAEQYDPLSYHLDEAAARAAGHDGLITSGYHTLSVVNGDVAREYRQDIATVAGFGIDDPRWPRPVDPGDTLTVFHELEAKRPAESRPDAGTTEVHIHATTDPDATVITTRRPGSSGGGPSERP